MKIDHPNFPFGVIGGVEAVARLTEATERRSRHVYRGTTTPPNIAQIGMVLRGLADHTAIMQALEYHPDADGPWPQATSIGRWFHAYADACEYQWRADHARRQPQDDSVAVARVRALHAPRAHSRWSDLHWHRRSMTFGEHECDNTCTTESTICDADGATYPCATIHALDEE